MEQVTQLLDSKDGSIVCSFTGWHYDCKQGQDIWVKKAGETLTRLAEVVEVEPDFVNLTVRRVVRTIKIHFKPIK